LTEPQILDFNSTQEHSGFSDHWSIRFWPGFSNEFWVL